jgi:hypothetical protein
MKVINIIRDGRDVVPSTIDPEKPIKFPSYSFGARQWRKSIIYAKKLLKKSDLELKYKDLILNPKKEINRIFKFLNLPTLSKKEILSFHKKLSTQEKSLIRKAKNPLTNSSLQKWKKTITPKQKKIFKQQAGKILIEEGYEKDDDW